MKHTRLKLSVLLSLMLAKHVFSQVTTSQYDNARTGATLSEKILTPRNVNAEHFGKLGEFHVGDSEIEGAGQLVKNLPITLL